MSQEIILYDLPSKPPCRSWSANAWKTRLLLNFKGIPYKTEWVPYTRLQETLKATGLDPNPPGSWAPYTVPTIRFPEGSYLMDSEVIAVALESRYPSPSLHLNAELEQQAGAAMFEVFLPLVPYFFPHAVNNLVAPEDVEWFKADRAPRFGMTIEEMMVEKDAEAAYAAAQPGFEKIRAALTEHKKDEGPFILGSVPCYADFYIVSTTHMFDLAWPNEFERFLEQAGSGLKDLYEACEKWMMMAD